MILDILEQNLIALIGKNEKKNIYLYKIKDI
jgi:hypothetical protein